MLSTAQYIETNLHIPYNQFIEVLQKMPLELKNKLQSDWIKPTKEKSKPTTRKKTHSKESDNTEIVVYTTNGKGLTQAEYSAHILKLSDEAHAGIGLIPHNEVVNRIKKIMNEKRKITSDLEK